MSVSTATTLMLLDSRVRPGTVTLPLTTTIPGRTLTLKDSTGASGVSTVTISTSGGETFEDGTTTKTLNTAYGFLNLTGNGGKWYTAAANQVTRAINPINIYGTESLNAMLLGADYGVVTTFAGSGSGAVTNGTGTAASFSNPEGVVYDPVSNCLYASERGGGTIRKITLAGVVTTLASGFSGLRNGITVDPAGNVYVVDAGTNTLKKVTSGGTVTTFAGSGATASTDGTGTNAAFNNPYGLTCDPTGTFLYVSDASTNKIRRVTIAGAVVTTFAGSGGGGSQDGTGTNATFNTPTGLVCDSAGNVYVGDQGSNKIRKITPAGVVTTLAGSGSSSVVDGTGTGASFQNPSGIGIDPVTGNLYVADWYGYTIRKVTPAGVVTTIAGRPGVASVVNGLGSAATFNQPTAIALDPAENLYVTDFGGHTLRKITLVTTLHNVIISTSGFITAPAVSTLALNISSINGQTPIGLSTMISTVAGLGTTGYISTASLTSSLVGSRFTGSTIFLSAAIAQISSLSTVNIQAATGYVSSLTVDSLQIGSNAAFFTMGDVLATSISTFQVNTGVLYMNSTFIGNASSQTALQFFGNTGAYNQTALAEVSTGSGTQELLVFRGSSASDRIRMQTTGTIVFEPGVTSRLWPVAPSNVTPAMIINTASNVGIQTATPAFPLDVAGTARAQTLSTLALNASSINGLTPWQPIFLQSTVAGLGQTYASTASLRASISTIFVSAAQIQAGQLSSLQLFVSSINGAIPGTGSGGTFVGSTIFLSAATIQASTLSSLTFQANSGYVSSLTVDSLQIGSNAAFISLGDSIATSLSTIVVRSGVVNASQLNASTISTTTLFTQSTLLGASSLQTAVQFYGLTGNYTNTVLAEQSTSATSQEFIVFRGSSATDRIRMQTTGNIVFEPGVTSRLWPNTPSNVTPAMIINTASNIGILTASPTVPLDVAGIVRAQFMSTLNLQVCTINGAAPGTGSGGTTFVGSTIFLSSAQGFISSLTVNALTIGTTAGFTVMGDVIAASMSTINLNVSTINGGLPGSGSSSAFNGSTISVSTLQLFDPALTFSSIGNLSVRSSLLLYNSTVVAGARQVQAQMFTF